MSVKVAGDVAFTSTGAKLRNFAGDITFTGAGAKLRNLWKQQIQTKHTVNLTVG